VPVVAELKQTDQIKQHILFGDWFSKALWIDKLSC